MGDKQARRTSQWPVEVNGHSVKRTTPSTFVPVGCAGIEYDDEVAFQCERCNHEMHPPKGRIEDSEWVKNAFDCVECNHE